VVVREGRPAVRVEFRRDPRDQPFGDREITIVGVMARANWLRPGGPRPLDAFAALDGFGGSDRLTAGGLSAGTLGAGSSSVVASLPRRQHRVLDRLRNGDSGKEVAIALGMTANTAREHVKRLCKRFNVSSRPELIARLFCGDEAKAASDRHQA
jgi:DNA-binding CsgD family transcriptional regulator